MAMPGGGLSGRQTCETSTELEMRVGAALRNRFGVQEARGMCRLGFAAIAAEGGAPAGSPGAAELKFQIFVMQRPENGNRDRGYRHG